jgi:hypothetical protein
MAGIQPSEAKYYKHILGRTPYRRNPDGDWRQTEAVAKAHFNGYRRLANPHQNCVDIFLSRHLTERPQLPPARAEAVSLPCVVVLGL